MSRMAKLLALSGACVAMILLGAWFSAARPRSAPRSAGISYLPELERSVYHLTNTVRRRHRLAPLAWEGSLGAVARSHSADMLHRNFFSHQTPDGGSPHDRIRTRYPFALAMSGENIWSGSGYNPADTTALARIMVENWLSSPGHRQNLLNPDFTDIGVGVAVRGRDIRATQVFAGRRR
ncbi:MAG: CAP domain-containing protein [Desulfobaccales bacterium]